MGMTAAAAQNPVAAMYSLLFQNNPAMTGRLNGNRHDMDSMTSAGEKK